MRRRRVADAESFEILGWGSIAKGLMGKKVGEEAVIEVPVGTVHYQVLSIEKYFPDED